MSILLDFTYYRSSKQSSKEEDGAIIEDEIKFLALKVDWQKWSLQLGLSLNGAARDLLDYGTGRESLWDVLSQYGVVDHCSISRIVAIRNCCFLLDYFKEVR
jgi:hypothetical protein